MTAQTIPFPSSTERDMSSSSGASKFQELLKSTLANRGIPLTEQSTSNGNATQLTSSSSGVVQRISSIKQTQNVLDELKLSLRQKVIDTKRESLSTTSDFEALYRSLSSFPTMNYDDFLRYATKAPISTQRFFTSQTFLMFPKDKRGGILVESFLRFVQRSIDVELVSLQLIGKNCYLGYINEQELERFILNRIPEIGACEDLPESFYPYYVFTASKRLVCLSRIIGHLLINTPTHDTLCCFSLTLQISLFFGCSANTTY